MAEGRGGRFTMVIMQAGPIPPSGGPLREQYLDHHGREALRVASAEYMEAVALLGDRAGSMPALDFALVESDGEKRRAIQRDKRVQWKEFRVATDQLSLDAIEPHIKSSISASVNALNYLEDHPLREEAHAAIHRAAFVGRGLFGCAVVLRDGDFWSGCPINVSHIRRGVSAGLVSDFACSICGELAEDCDHQMGQVYPKVAGRNAAGECNICDSLECEHVEGETFLVQALASAQNVRTSEVSFVARPRYPLARLIDLSIDLGPLHDDPRVIHAAENGYLNCDIDLGPCNGLNEMADQDLNDLSRSLIDVAEEVDFVAGAARKVVP